MEQYEDMLAELDYVTNQFNDSSSPWRIYEADFAGIKHIRYREDSTGDNVWYKRLTKFFAKITKDYLKPGELWLKINDGKRGNWFSHVAIMWDVHVRYDANLPDAIVNEGHIITLWQENASYVSLFGPNVGKEVLKFIKADPHNSHAQRIVKAMYTSYVVNKSDSKEEE